MPLLSTRIAVAATVALACLLSTAAAGSVTCNGTVVTNCGSCDGNTTACGSCDADFYLSAGSCSACGTCTGSYVVDTACNATHNTVCRLGSFATGNVVLNVLGQSGKFDLIPLDADGSQMNDKKLRVEMDALRELDASGNSVGTAGPNDGKHGRNTFANTDFTLVPLVETVYQGVLAKVVSFYVPLVNNAANLTIDTYLFGADGNVTFGNSTVSETFAVSPGTLKFNVAVDNWPFCSGAGGNPCQGSTGASLEIDIKVTPPSSSAVSSSSSGNKEVYDFGEGATMRLSSLMQVGGVYQYGNVSFSSDVLTINFPRPAAGLPSNFLYDPLLGFDGGSTNAASSASASLFTLAAVLVLAVLTGASTWWH